MSSQPWSPQSNLSALDGGGREGRGEGGEGRRGEERDVSSVNRIPCVCVCVLTGDGGRDENEETERCQVGQFPVQHSQEIIDQSHVLWTNHTT